MEKFTVRLEFGGDVVCEVEGRGPDSAADLAVAKVNSQRGLIAERITGDRGGSGWFQGMRRFGGGYTSTGPKFLVQ